MDPQRSEHRRCYCVHGLARDSGISKLELSKMLYRLVQILVAWPRSLSRGGLAQILVLGILVRTEKMPLLFVKLKNSCNFVSFAPIELRLRLRKVEFFHLGTFFHRQFIFRAGLTPDPCGLAQILVQRWLGPDPLSRGELGRSLTRLARSLSRPKEIVQVIKVY